MPIIEILLSANTDADTNKAKKKIPFVKSNSEKLKYKKKL